MRENFYEILSECPLFGGIEREELAALLKCLSAKFAAYGRHETVFAAGAAVVHIGIVLAGSVHIERDDYWGNRAILSRLGPGDLFGEAFSCAGIEHMPVSATAVEASEIMLIDYRRIATSCSSACAFHQRLVLNMMRILAEKNVALTRKMEALTQRSTRNKLLAYLSQQAKQRGEHQFEIPFNRQELADYLSVERSAMSGELSKMRKEGLLRYQKNRFELL